MPDAPIDREAVVRRHDIHLTAPDPLEALSVGNGELAFTVDVTGLQTFTRFHDAPANRAATTPVTPLHIQSQWGFHEMPNPDGFTLEDVMAPYDSPRGPIDFPVRYDFRKGRDELTDDEQAGYFLWVNPQRLDLGRLALELRATPDSEPSDDIADLSAVDQHLELWTGTLHSRFTFGGVPFQVTTASHPDRDLIAVRIRSQALADGRATALLAFPYASDTFADTADWDSADAHTTQLVHGEPGVTRFLRTLDDTRYVAATRTAPGTELTELGEHRFRFRAVGDELEIVLAFAPETDATNALPDAEQVFEASASGWRSFWLAGAAIDLAGSTDPRADELERRIVLSQYVTRVHCAGSMPSAETGLVQNSWAGKFNLEMHWWHAAHFAMWGRPELLERSLAWYLDALPVAQGIAARQGYPGARWPKHVGPEGRESPNNIGPLLTWQQPHPIHFAELVRRARSADNDAVVERYGEIVEETAVFMAGLLYRDADGSVNLAPPVMPAQEVYDPASVWNPTFELAYFAWGLRTAQEWREARGLPRHPEWDELVAGMAPLPKAESGYAAVDRPVRTTYTDHPSMVAALGVVPRTELVDDATMLATLHTVVDDWQWESAWGWDFPMMAMTATRLGEAELAVDTLLMNSPRNRYLRSGHNCQDPLRLPLYVPGNGGLLAAVALMASGWDGSDAQHPGFPDTGWNVRAEGFAPRP